MSDIQARKQALAARLAPKILDALDWDGHHGEYTSPTKDLSFQVLARDPVDIDATHPEPYVLQTLDAKGFNIASHRVADLEAAADRIALALVDEGIELHRQIIAAEKALDIHPVTMT